MTNHIDYKTDGFFPNTNIMLVIYVCGINISLKTFMSIKFFENEW